MKQAMQDVTSRVRCKDVPSAARMTSAIVDSGKYEPVPENEVIEIAAYPLGPDNTAVPASMRRQMRFRPGGVPLKLSSVKQKKTRSEYVFVEVNYSCTPFPLCGNENSLTIDRTSCAVFTMADACDPLFDGLTELECVPPISCAVIANGNAQACHRS